jgi:hypothetical protein
LADWDSGRTLRGAYESAPGIRPPSQAGESLMNIYTIGAICGIVALVLVVIFVL